MILDAATSTALGRAGQQLALDFYGEWREAVLLEFQAWAAIKKASGQTVITIEQFRAAARSQPPSHKAWGALPRVLCRAGLIAPKWVVPGVQMRVKAGSLRTHGHEIKCWELC